MKEQEIKLLEQTKRIPTKQINTDIQDTLAEIKTKRREIQGLRLINDRISNYKADARELGIKEREQFIKKLEEILRLRKEATV